MQQMTINELTHEGMRHVKILGTEPILLPVRILDKVIPLEARGRVTLTPGQDDLLGLFSLYVTWHVFEPYDFFIYGPKKFRRLMVVSTVYAERVSACIELARTEFFSRTHFAPLYAFVRDLPRGAEIGMVVHECILMQAEWMPANCVAIGGRDA